MRLKLVKDGASSPDSSLVCSAKTPQPAGSGTSTHQPLGPEHYSEIEERLGYRFVDRGRLESALTHRSLHTVGVKNDYERLEFLGDAVFDLAVAHLLLDQHQDAHEGDLSKMRAALVNTASLAHVARGLELGKFIKLSRSELASGAHERASILADVLEAVMGAIYREAGFAVAYGCVAKLLGDSVLTVTPRDPKTELQEAMHASGREPPLYKLECVEGPEHSPVFISVVEIQGEIVGRGRGTTKKASQQAAAEEALQRLALRTCAEQGFSLTPADNSSDDSGQEGRDSASKVSTDLATQESNHE